MVPILKDPDISHDVSVICSWAKRTEIVERVWLFGSRVRGSNDPDSDLDVAIEHGVAKGDSNAFTTALSERDKWIEELQSQTKLELDIWSYRHEETPTVEKGIRKGALLIYDKVNGCLF
jgi:predicted nucleotidyltransferase